MLDHVRSGYFDDSDGEYIGKHNAFGDEELKKGDVVKYLEVYETKKPLIRLYFNITVSSYDTKTVYVTL